MIFFFIYEICKYLISFLTKIKINYVYIIIMGNVMDNKK